MCEQTTEEEEEASGRPVEPRRNNVDHKMCQNHNVGQKVQILLAIVVLRRNRVVKMKM